eukprot:8226332-Alexandrium_andersonii.AAC.1
MTSRKKATKLDSPSPLMMMWPRPSFCKNSLACATPKAHTPLRTGDEEAARQARLHEDHRDRRDGRLALARA